MLVQRRIQEEIHGNKTAPSGTRTTISFDESAAEHPSLSQDYLPEVQQSKRPVVEQKPSSNGRRSQVEERVPSAVSVVPPKKSPNISVDLISALSDYDDDDDMSTNEIVARNQSKLDFHKTMTPMCVDMDDQLFQGRACRF